MTVNIKKISKKVWIPVASFLAVLLIGGIALAATTITHYGTVNVINPPQETYTFAVFTASEGETEIATGDQSFWSIGTVNTGASVQKHVYIGRTGSGTVTVTPSVSDLSSGTLTFSPTTVTLSDSTRQHVIATYTAGTTPTETTDQFTVVFTGSP